MKQRQKELKVGVNSRRGGNASGPARDSSVKVLRQQERSWVEQAEKSLYPVRHRLAGDATNEEETYSQNQREAGNDVM